MDALFVWMNDVFLDTAKRANPHYGALPALSLSQRDFERLALPQLEEALGHELGGLATTQEIANLSLWGGVLQWWMIHALFAAILAGVSQYLMNVYVEKRHFQCFARLVAAKISRRR